MKSQRIITVALISSAVLLAVACVPKKDPVAKVKSEGFSCNLAESEKASNAASKAAFDCAYKSMKQAGKLATGAMAKDIADALLALDELRVGIEGAVGLISELSEYLNNNGTNPNPDTPATADDDPTKNAQDAATGAQRVAKISNPEYAKTAMYKCLNGQYQTIKEFYGIVKIGQSMKDSSQLTSVQVQKMGEISLSFTGSILDLISTNLSCSEWLGQKRMLSVQKALKAIEAIKGPIDSLLVIAQCGVDLGRGGYVLYNNAQCLSDDISHYYESRERLENSRDHYVENTKVPSEDNQRGVNACMSKYGIFLGKQSFYSYVYQSSACGDYCGNGKTANSYYQQNLESIFPRQDDYDWCRQNASGAMGFDAVRQCAVYCCNQDSDCATDAMKRAGF